MTGHRHAVSAGSLAILLALGAACGSEPAKPATAKIVPTETPEMSPEEAGGMRAEDATTGAPKLPHGGTAVKLGDAGQLEFVLDPSSGLLTGYVLNPAGQSLRIPAKAIDLSVTAPGGQPTALALTSTANGLTGDTVGNSSQFGGTSPVLKGVTAFTGIVKRAEVGGQTLTDVAFSYPAK